MTPPKPRILLWDIETVFNKVAVFQLMHQDYISHENVLQERYIVSAAWKFLDQKGVQSVSVLDDPKRFAKNSSDDYAVVKRLHEVLSSADVIVAHNGDSYDIKYTEGRILFHGLSPLPPIVKIDTLKTARNRFYLNSNKLDYLAHFLKVGGKTKTDNELWLKVLSGDVKATEKMVRYNKHDIIILEKVFKKLQPYMDNHVNLQLYGNLAHDACPRCGSKHVQSRGMHRATTNQYVRYQCQSCGGWFRQRLSDKSHKITLRVL